jgi:hypothetical protein
MCNVCIIYYTGYVHIYDIYDMYDRTSYEATEKKHWLTVHQGELVGRFLLQDNLKPAWHDDPRSTPVRVRAAVEQLIARLDEKK